MKVGLHSVGYSGTWGGQAHLTLKQFINKAAALGYEAVEFAGKRPHASPLDLNKKDREEIKELLEEKNLELSCIASYHDWSAFFEHNDMAYYEKELLYLKSNIELAYDLGCGIVRTYTGYFKEGIPYRAQWESCVKGIKEGARIAAAYGITLGIQNHSCIASDPDSFKDFMAEINEPNAKVVLDAPYIDNHFKPLRETVLKFKGMIVHTHLTDFVRREKFKYVPETVTFEKNGLEMIAVPLGKGGIDYVEFINTLKEVGYDGCLSYEMCSPLVGGGNEENLDKSAVESLNFVKSILEK